MRTAPVNRVLLVLFLVAVLACGVLGNVAVRERQRADRAELQLRAVLALSAATDSHDPRYREIEEAVAEVRDFARRHPLPR